MPNGIAFRMNDDWWSVNRVPPSSPTLIDRTGKLTLATTDSRTKTVNVSNAVTGDMLNRVLAHEAAHAAMESYGIAARIRRSVVPWKRVEVEEIICNLIADHGEAILQTADEIVYQLTK